MLPVVKGKTGSMLLFMLVFALSRIPGMLWPEAANFSAAYALMFCAGVYLTGRAAWWMPLTAMVLTDIALNFYYWLGRGYDVWQLPFLRYQVFNYRAYLAIILLGRRFKPKNSFMSLLGGGVLGALLFYFITNTASWLFNPFQNPEYTDKSFFSWLIALIKGTGGWPETWTFFRNTLMSGGLFTGLFVGAMKLSTAESAEEKKEPARADEPEGEESPTPEEAKA